MTETPTHTPLPELLPCPFCGSHNVDVEGWLSTDSKGPACDDCGASAGAVSTDHIANVAAWNTRADSHHRLVEALKTARDYVSDASRGHLTYEGSGEGFIEMAKEDLERIDAALKEARHD